MSATDQTPKKLSPVLHWALLSCGFIALALALIGIFLPVLPTVPFLLLALACFARSSERFYARLLNHVYFGPMIRPYLQGQGIPRSAKFKALALLWTSIGFSALFLLQLLWLKILLLLIATLVTIHLLRLPEAKNGA